MFLNKKADSLTWQYSYLLSDIFLNFSYCLNSKFADIPFALGMIAKFYFYLVVLYYIFKGKASWFSSRLALIVVVTKIVDFSWLLMIYGQYNFAWYYFFAAFSFTVLIVSLYDLFFLFLVQLVSLLGLGRLFRVIIILFLLVARLLFINEYFFYPLGSSYGFPVNVFNCSNPAILYFFNKHATKKVQKRDKIFLNVVDRVDLFDKQILSVRRDQLLLLLQECVQKKETVLLVAPEAFFEEDFFEDEFFLDEIKNLINKKRNLHFAFGAYHKVNNKLYQAAFCCNNQHFFWYHKKRLVPLFEPLFFEQGHFGQRTGMFIDGCYYKILICSEFFLCPFIKFATSTKGAIILAKESSFPRFFQAKMAAYFYGAAFVGKKAPSKRNFIYADYSSLRIIGFFDSI